MSTNALVAKGNLLEPALASLTARRILPIPHQQASAADLSCGEQSVLIPAILLIMSSDIAILT